MASSVTTSCLRPQTRNIAVPLTSGRLTPTQLPLHRTNSTIYIMFHPNYRLSSRRSIWWSQPAEDMTTLSAWCAERSATDVVNHSLVAVPSVWPPGHELPRREWVPLNRFRIGQGRCAANMVRWKQSSDPRCSCGEIQTMSHIVDD